MREEIKTSCLEREEVWSWRMQYNHSTLLRSSRLRQQSRPGTNQTDYGRAACDKHQDMNIINSKKKEEIPPPSSTCLRRRHQPLLPLRLSALLSSMKIGHEPVKRTLKSPRHATRGARRGGSVEGSALCCRTPGTS